MKLPKLLILSALLSSGAQAGSWTTSCVGTLGQDKEVAYDMYNLVVIKKSVAAMDPKDLKDIQEVSTRYVAESGGVLENTVLLTKKTIYGETSEDSYLLKIVSNKFIAETVEYIPCDRERFRERAEASTEIKAIFVSPTGDEQTMNLKCSEVTVTTCG